MDESLQGPNPLQTGISQGQPSEFDLPGDRKLGTVQPVEKKSSSKGILVLLLLIFIGAATGIGGYFFGQYTCEECAEITCPPDEQGSEEDEDMYSCVEDQDCIIVTDGCCNCNEGGKNTSINKNYKIIWEDHLLEDCVDAVCPEVISDDENCNPNAVAMCIDGKCSVQPVVGEGEEDPYADWEECENEDFNLKVKHSSDWSCETKKSDWGQEITLKNGEKEISLLETYSISSNFRGEECLKDEVKITYIEIGTEKVEVTYCQEGLTPQILTMFFVQDVGSQGGFTIIASGFDELTDDDEKELKMIFDSIELIE